MKIALILLISLVFLTREFHAQCFDCAKARRMGDCRLPLRHKCHKGLVKFAPKTPEELMTEEPESMFSECVPYPFHLEYVSDYCCFSSEEKGCQVALYPKVTRAESNPYKYCHFCRETCGCQSFRGAGVKSLKDRGLWLIKILSAASVVYTMFHL